MKISKLIKLSVFIVIKVPVNALMATKDEMMNFIQEDLKDRFEKGEELTPLQKKIVNDRLKLKNIALKKVLDIVGEYLE